MTSSVAVFEVSTWVKSMYMTYMYNIVYYWKPEKKNYGN